MTNDWLCPSAIADLNLLFTIQPHRFRTPQRLETLNNPKLNGDHELGKLYTIEPSIIES